MPKVTPTTNSLLIKAKNSFTESRIATGARTTEKATGFGVKLEAQTFFGHSQSFDRS